MSNISDKVVITPNASMNRKQMCWFLVLMTVTSLGIGIAFAWQGLWMVLPFAGLEMIFLATAFYCVQKSGSCREVVSVESDNVRVEAGRHAPEYVCVFQRAWTQVLLQTPKIKGYPSKLLLRSGGKQVEVGACLSDEERVALHDHLVKLVQLPSSMQLLANKNI